MNEADYDVADRDDVLLIADGIAAVADVRKAVAAAGCRFQRHALWQEASATIAETPAPTTLMVDAGSASDETVESVLPLLEARAAAGGRVVVSLRRDQIDLAGPLLGGGIAILCEPEIVDRIVALRTIAATGALTWHDTGAESERERLARLNEEVARIADTLARLTRRGTPVSMRMAPPGAGVEEGVRHGYFAGDAIAPVDDDGLTAADVRQAIRARRMRDEIFGYGLFEDPAWDMILDLFAARLERGQVSVSSLCIAAAVAPTTALRWIGKMVDAGLFVRAPDPFDKRRVFMALSDASIEGMRRYVAAMRKLDLSFA